jgi:hypothetical protein
MIFATVHRPEGASASIETKRASVSGLLQFDKDHPALIGFDDGEPFVIEIKKLAPVDRPPPAGDRTDDTVRG